MSCVGKVRKGTGRVSVTEELEDMGDSKNGEDSKKVTSGEVKQRRVAGQ